MWTSAQTNSEKFDMLMIDLGGGVQIDLAMAKIRAKGSFKYLQETKVCFFLVWIATQANPAVCQYQRSCLKCQVQDSKAFLSAARGFPTSLIGAINMKLCIHYSRITAKWTWQFSIICQKQKQKLCQEIFPSKKDQNGGYNNHDTNISMIEGLNPTVLFSSDFLRTTDQPMLSPPSLMEQTPTLSSQR